MTIRDQLRAAYDRSGMSMAAIALESGVSETTVRNALLTSRNVGIENVAAIACVLRLDVLIVARRNEN
jgi:lambda repressor-like predicted transcriptional regulator